MPFHSVQIDKNGNDIGPPRSSRGLKSLSLINHESAREKDGNDIDLSKPSGGFQSQSFIIHRTFSARDKDENEIILPKSSRVFDSQSFISNRTFSARDKNEIYLSRSSPGFESQSFISNSTFSVRDSINTYSSSARYTNPSSINEKSDDPEICTSDCESKSDIVPPLDINPSADTIPSSNFIPIDCNRKESNSSAFDNWLSGKKNFKSIECAKRKEITKEQQRLAEIKKTIAKEKYDLWLAKNMEAEQKKKLEILRAEEYKQKQAENRKEMSSKAWQKWVSTAPLKPKPVPLNQGFLTLRGTISDIYVNPNPWCD